jgi:hypothetical protein
MPALITRALCMLGIWAIAATLLWWTRLPGTWRRALALLSSALGVVFLVAAVSSEGLRESQTTAVFLMGTPYVTEEASASASLPFYVLTGVCLLLGTTGLALADEDAAALGRRWLLLAIATSTAVTILRFMLEKAAAPWALTNAVGVTWMAPVVGAFFAWNLRQEGRPFRALLGALAVYAFAVRGTVAALMLAASTLRLGSHYDVSALTQVRNPLSGEYHTFAAGSLKQVLQLGVVPQLVAWPVYTILAGLLGAALLWVLRSSWRTPPVPHVRPHVDIATARPES